MYVCTYWIWYKSVIYIVYVNSDTLKTDVLCISNLWLFQTKFKIHLFILPFMKLFRHLLKWFSLERGKNKTFFYVYMIIRITKHFHVNMKWQFFKSFVKQFLNTQGTKKWKKGERRKEKRKRKKKKKICMETTWHERISIVMKRMNVMTKQKKVVGDDGWKKCGM